MYSDMIHQRDTERNRVQQVLYSFKEKGMKIDFIFYKILKLKLHQKFVRVIIVVTGVCVYFRQPKLRHRVLSRTF